MISRRILFVQYTDPAAYPPVETLASRILAEQGWEVVLLGVANTATRKMQMSLMPEFKSKQFGLSKVESDKNSTTRSFFF